MFFWPTALRSLAGLRSELEIAGVRDHPHPLVPSECNHPAVKKVESPERKKQLPQSGQCRGLKIGSRIDGGLSAVCLYFPLSLDGLEDRAQRLGRGSAGLAVDVVQAALALLRAAIILVGHVLFTTASETILAAPSPSVRLTTLLSQAS